MRSLAVATLLATSLLGAAGGVPARAADDALSLVSSASYTLVPAKGLVRVTVDVTAKNNKADLVRETPNGTITTSYFYESARIAIHAEATAIRATAGGSRLATRVRKESGFAVLDVVFGSDLLFGQTRKFRVQYDLPGGAPRSESDIRVGSAFATFYAWAFGDRGDVKISVPAGFEVDTSGSTVSTSVTGGATTLTAGGIADVNDWYVVVVADRHDALTQERLDLAGGERLVVRAWPEDREWQTRVGGLLRVGLPVLADKIGLDWPVTGEIEVAEVHTPLLEGYAGVFYADEDRIEISEDLDELTIIHEASHAWFNSGLFTGRWINEGLADEYASRVLDEVSNGGFNPLVLGADAAGTVQLNAWTHPGRIDDDETNDRETFGYEASWTLTRKLVKEIGEDGMRKVLAAANDHEIAYVGAPEPEHVSTPNDWRRYFDLLEERGASKIADTVFERWIVTEDEKPLLEDRRVARRAYAALVDAGDGWLPGYVIRDPLGRWDFARATREIAAATAILETRDAIARVAAEAGVSPSGELEAAYEGAERDLGPVRDLATDELAAVTGLDEAVERVAAERGLLTSIGLIGEDPAATLDAARSAYAAGDLEATTSGADAVNGVFDRALDAGRTRAIGGIVAIGVGGAGIGWAVLLGRRRRSRRAVAAAAVTTEPAGATEPAESAEATGTAALALGGTESPAEPYATLGDPATTASAAAEPAGPGRAEGDES
jgi:hypothetical protein